MAAQFIPLPLDLAQIGRVHRARHPARWRSFAVAILAVLTLEVAWGQAAVPVQPTSTRSLNEWLDRLHDASRRRAYTGTFVVSAGSSMATSKIWHVCDGTEQMERIETLTGAPRTTLRRNDQVITFIPQSRVAWVEKRDSLRPFPDLLVTPGNAIEEHYGARHVGVERVAGHEADVVHIIPKDAMRFGYRVWSEKTTGLAVKVQTLDTQGRVLEQMVFSELQMDAPVSMDKLRRQMSETEGYKLHSPQLAKITPEQEGWRLRGVVPGFQSMGSHTRTELIGQPAGARPMQWVFSDGLASVSLFLEPRDPQRHAQERSTAVGATHTLTLRVGDHWVTAMGEVPLASLRQFAGSLERLR